jgi:hypothetical protein
MDLNGKKTNNDINGFINKEKQMQAIKAFNIYVEKLILKLKPVVLATDEITEKEYDNVYSLIRKFVIPGNPKLIVSFFKSLIFDDYYDYIKNKDDSLFSVGAVMNEYKNIFNKLKNKDATNGMNEIGSFLDGKIVKGNNKKITKENIEKQIKKLSSQEGENIFISKKDTIEIELNKCRTKWDSIEEKEKNEVWKILQAMSVLVKKHIYN